ncbi:MAG: glycerate kinase [Chloroflexi bacterium]|nr:glycerate kinase [Chloroflexota bacterium]|tara:strand:- start:100792 stop:101946 length:1155 start_codon:yes stop_codon:yes gene_type:complete
MKIIIAPQAFKGSISALKVAEAMSEGALKIFPKAKIVICPVADGGDGTLETLVDISNGEINKCSVHNPMGKIIDAEWGAMGDGKTAVIEMARSSGLALLDPKKLNPLKASTYGLGELIQDALNKGFKKFIIGIGGSATNDAGAGMAQALGVKLLDRKGVEIAPGGINLMNLTTIDMSGIDERILDSDFQIACDVTNPLTGPEGASEVYGPQKGATRKMIDDLDASLQHFNEIVIKTFNKDISKVPGSGAAGGLGAGMITFTDATLRPGIDIVLDAVALNEKIAKADLVITGEGAMDFQTIYDKAPIGVAKIAKRHGIPTIGISGMLGKNYQLVHEHGIDAAMSIVTGPMTLPEASEKSYELISNSVSECLRLINIGFKIKNPGK